MDIRRWVLFGLAVALAMGCQGEGGEDRPADDVAPNGDAGPDEDPESGRDAGETSTPDRVGIFSQLNNYVELDTDPAPLGFHFGAGNSAFGVLLGPVSGDWDGDGLDTLGIYDQGDARFTLADENDSDEWAPRGTVAELLDVPPPPPLWDQLPVAGDWDGDGIDGIGVYNQVSNTFYLRQDPSSGRPDITFTLGEDDGYSPFAQPLAGDFDGDGADEVALFDGRTVSVRFTLTAGPPDLSYTARGWLVAGDFDGDGVDTFASLDPATNTFTINDTHTPGQVSATMQLGFADESFWRWWPLAGVWEVPATPVASDGYDWTVEAPEAHGLDPTALDEALVDAGSVANVLSVLVVRDGVLVGEAYFHGYDRRIAVNIKSVSKSLLSALYGIALEDGVIASLDDPIADYLPSYFEDSTDPTKLTVTLSDMITMRGGFDWDESRGSVGRMIGSEDYVGYVLDQPITTTPGVTFNYNTGLSHVGSAVLTEASGVATRDYARERLFEPLGISVVRWDRSPEGYFFGGAEVWMRPRDMARFGLLYLRQGSLDGQQILPPTWVEMSADPWISTGDKRYGDWWWGRSWANYPEDDSFFALGYGGQLIFLFPSWDLVVVVTSKWNVEGNVSSASVGAIYSFVDEGILTSVRP